MAIPARLHPIVVVRARGMPTLAQRMRERGPLLSAMLAPVRMYARVKARLAIAHLVGSHP